MTNVRKLVSSGAGIDDVIHRKSKLSVMQTLLNDGKVDQDAVTSNTTMGSAPL